MFWRPAFWLGVGAVVVYEFFPQIVKAMRPVAIHTMKTGLAVADQLKVSASETRESFEDMMAEARSQYHTEKEAAHEHEHDHDHEEEAAPQRKKSPRKSS